MNEMDIYADASDLDENLEASAPAPEYVKDIFEWLEVLVTAMISVVIIFSFLFRIASIDGDSMENTLIHGQKIIITNLFYTPEVGDIVVVSRNTFNDAHNIQQSSMRPL